MDTVHLINQHISLLGLSTKFVNDSRTMQFETIADILAVNRDELVNKKGFNYNWFGELVTFLSEHQLVYLLQPPPGSSHD
jgi:hypothetical protein